VTFLEALPQILTGVDPEAVRLVQKGIRQRGGTVHVKAVARGSRGRAARSSSTAEVDGKRSTSSATRSWWRSGSGRTRAGMGSEKVGVKIGPKAVRRGGRAVPHERSRRSSRSATSPVPPFLAHKASKERRDSPPQVIAGMKSARDWVALPGAIFTIRDRDVGLSEEEAPAQGPRSDRPEVRPSARSAARSPSRTPRGS